MKTIEINSPSELGRVATAILESLDQRRVVALRGGMGAGKTTLVREIVAQMGAADAVTSPTFAIVNQYVTEKGMVHHFDFYRINDIREAYDFGYEEYFYSGELCLVEWPERVEELMPDDIVTVKIEITGDESRTFTID